MLQPLFILCYLTENVNMLLHEKEKVMRGNIMEYIITALAVLVCIILVVAKNKKPTEDQLEKQKKEYEEILAIL